MTSAGLIAKIKGSAQPIVYGSVSPSGMKQWSENPYEQNFYSTYHYRLSPNVAVEFSVFFAKNPYETVEYIRVETLVYSTGGARLREAAQQKFIS